MVQAACDLLGSKPQQVLADAGYWSESNVWELRKADIDPYIPPRRMKHDEVVEPPRGRMPRRLICTVHNLLKLYRATA